MYWQQSGTTHILINAIHWLHRPCSTLSLFHRVSKKPSVKGAGSHTVQPSTSDPMCYLVEFLAFNDCCILAILTSYPSLLYYKLVTTRVRLTSYTGMNSIGVCSLLCSSSLLCSPQCEPRCRVTRCFISSNRTQSFDHKEIFVTKNLIKFQLKNIPQLESLFLRQ